MTLRNLLDLKLLKWTHHHLPSWRLYLNDRLQLVLIFSNVFKDAWLYPLKQINDVLIPVRFLEHEIVKGVFRVGIRDILIALMLLCLFELLQLDSVRAELLHV